MNAIQVRDWYAARTSHILERYGPGPRVHYHTGLLDDTPATLDIDLLKSTIREAQSRLLSHAAQEWRAASRFTNADLLDSGCGLGGSTFFWVENYNAHVTGVNLVQEHLDLVNVYAHKLGIAHRVDTLCCDAHDVHLHPQRYDAAIAIDSACHMDVPRWLTSLRKVLRPNGKLYVTGPFAGPQVRFHDLAHVNTYMSSNIQPVADYLPHVASVKVWDMSDSASEFYRATYSLILLQAAKANNFPDKAESLAMHRLLSGMFRARHLQYLMLEVDPWL